jgi:hypothetical protein
MKQYLIDGVNEPKPVRVGLTDKHGAFLLLVDENVVKYYQFNNQVEATKALLDHIDELERQVADDIVTIRGLREKLDRRDKSLFELREKIANAEGLIDMLTPKPKEASDGSKQ